jgi:hypothetical protein
MENMIMLKSFEAPALAISIEAEKIQEDLLERAKDFVIFDAEDQLKCVELMKEIKTVTKSVDATRKELKQPYADFGKKIEAVAAAYSTPLEKASDNLSKILTEFQNEERKRQEAVQKKIEAERVKLEIEAQKKLAAAKTDEKVMEIAEKVEKKSAELQVQYKEAAAPKASGMVERNVPVYQILDIKKFYEAYPHLVELSEKRSLVNEAIKTRSVQPLPGVFTCEMKKEFGVSTR